jgi:hypothetical protein
MRPVRERTEQFPAVPPSHVQERLVVPSRLEQDVDRVVVARRAAGAVIGLFAREVEVVNAAGGGGGIAFIDRRLQVLERVVGLVVPLEQRPEAEGRVRETRGIIERLEGRVSFAVEGERRFA